MRNGARSTLWLASCLSLVAASCDDAKGDASDTDAATFENVCSDPNHHRVQCVTPGQVIQGSTLPASFDSNNCQIRTQTKNSCCKPAVQGPRLIGGQCCYGFCEDSCC